MSFELDLPVDVCFLGLNVISITLNALWEIS